MLRSVYISLLILGLSWARDPIRARALPTISNSLVNLGKMDITFHINGAKEPEIPVKDAFNPLNSKPLPTIDECMCNNLRAGNFKDPFFGGTSEIFNKILMSNDLFNFNKDHMTGSQCCESHEENIVTFEFGPKAIGNSQKPIIPLPQMIFDNFMPKKSQIKPKAIEIFLFPKNKDGNKKPWLSSFSSLPAKKTVKKDIKMVGDKETQNVYDTLKLETEKPSALENMKYETVEAVTVKKEKEIGIKEQEDVNKPKVKEEPPKEETPSVSFPNNL